MEKPLLLEPCADPDCDGDYLYSNACGAWACSACNHHKSLERCYCGYSQTYPGGGFQELVEMGETIDPE